MTRLLVNATTFATFATFAAAASAVACHRAMQVTPASPGVVTIARGFAQPENLVYDAASDVYLVSNMGPGDPAGRDGNGYISRVSPDGRMLALRWIAGGVGGAVLDAPKGLAIRGDTLAVADVGGVHLFNRRTGAPLRTIALPGLVMNDVAFASDGSLWITDTGPDRTASPPDTTKDLDAVWRVAPNGRVQAVARGLFLARPDGIVLDGATALVATFGGNRLERVGAEPNAMSTFATLPGARVDGLRRLADGSLVVTSWDARKVWRLDGDKRETTLLAGVTSPAGVALDTRRGRLAVTSMQGNAMYLVPIR